MALNAIDGMLAREFGQKSRLGFYLNELTDPISDAALYLPFAFVEPFTLGGIAAIHRCHFRSSELAGVLGLAAGAGAPYRGPLGKSDRALTFGAPPCRLGVGAPRFAELRWIVPVVLVLLAVTIVRRVRAGLREAPRGVMAAKVERAVEDSRVSRPPTVRNSSTATGRRKRRIPGAPSSCSTAGMSIRVGMVHLPPELDLPDFAFFAWDARGHGRSQGRRGDSPSVAVSVRDIQTFVDHIAATYGIAPADMRGDRAERRRRLGRYLGA